jgi:hypothetical protein
MEDYDSISLLIIILLINDQVLSLLLLGISVKRSWKNKQIVLNFD